eukprot:TRINITY_DN19194_c0_g1_i1.p1 TRINITY_DN19194_c0_g1~~TRINITY_DN19194_c0_g1_i1.p1  ORF type:complete len:642 (+),score=75.47 TRINITY_DN19194_c0_g1_i1:58-1983(+)
MPKLQAHIQHKPWRGVNLGGWLLLEPGPSGPLFPKYKKECKKQLNCEWSLMLELRKRNELQALARHRETFYKRKDFEAIREAGLNAVRLPFGYWVVLGPGAGEPYVGPAIEYIDRAVAWAEELGLQILLDLHGAPGGESGDPPCGHQMSPEGSWKWRQWRFDESLDALKILAERYRNREAVTGIAVCNEPSSAVPARKLCEFYDLAVRTIREAGMREDKVAVTLPCFKRDLPEFAEVWKAVSHGKHNNICFDLHHYYCFGSKADARTLAQQLRLVEFRASELLRYPTVIGEWSLALGHTSGRVNLSSAKVSAVFAAAQLSAYENASHGYFFWCWKDRHSISWSYRRCYAAGYFSGSPLKLPQWNGEERDPLEDVLEPLPRNPALCYGDIVCVRGFHGRLLDVQGHSVQARFGKAGDWQRFVLVPGTPQWGAPVHDGDDIRLLAHNGHFVSVVSAHSSGPGDKGVVRASRGPRTLEASRLKLKRVRSSVGVGDSGDCEQFGQRPLQHRDKVCLRSKFSSKLLHADGRSNCIGAHWKNGATGKRQTWRELALERTQLHRAAWREFNVERVPGHDFSEEQTRVLVRQLVASRKCDQPCSNKALKRMRAWCRSLAKSATKRQRVELAPYLPTDGKRRRIVARARK